MVRLQVLHHVRSQHSLTVPGLILVASIDDEQVMRPPQTYFLRKRLRQVQSESELTDIKSKVKQLLRRVNRNSEPQASIESDQYFIQQVHCPLPEMDSTNSR